MFKKAGSAAKRNMRKRPVTDPDDSLDSPTLTLATAGDANTTPHTSAKKRSHSDDDGDSNNSDGDAQGSSEVTTIHKRQRTSGPSAAASETPTDPTFADLTRLVASSKSSRPAKPDLKVTYASSTSAASSSPADVATRTIDLDGPATPASARASASARIVGPQRAPSHLRVTSRFDYQPDICKDYKQTGFCGYGDSCKFLHDRGDYKSGWQLDKEWDANQKARRDAERLALLHADAEEVVEEVVDEVDELPFACFICRGDFKRPVVTKCGHYFCEACVVERAKKGVSKCAACGEQTGGMVKPAKELMAKLEERKRRIKEREDEVRRVNQEQTDHE